ncbi:undecaprenyldiphospho-muramoylpentapeptide beta-N-acetylglucosaminyltransferase [Salinisphaera sp. USBA-960]|uniref:undecaprenyldiphospho-muramoylpentapeptide beta-N-acetylglucosaminyltransferase n=1 Tax=Salinisphaera orenii TaxID=856731 RepID=UPI000DBE07CF|nr:undecaprenyldiphospho-muramoylpentapeptide beta-N-acetylglucosaminyltransferase [Salifodinibacter halophilus]NNC26758.1 undecaprenyldiphospho-muramoylpentapeptide beta-N-acetylglucosaminyltransferase [Salifodinibacter halophilus]
MSALDTRVLIAAGGTGGHVFPGLAVADALDARGAHVAWLGTSTGLESRAVPTAGYALHTVRVSALRGKRRGTQLLAPFRIAWAVLSALAVLRRVRPTVVLCMGGFAAGPGALAGWLMRCPVIVHEQNKSAGLTNRVAARFAARVLQAFPNTFGPERDAETVGNPVRDDVLALPAPDERWRERTGAIRLLVLGGSGGALALNERLPKAVAALPAGQQPIVWHQAGRTRAAADDAYAQAGIDAEVVAFIDDMAAAYAWADVVVCRAGALTVAELAAAGVGALMIPYPFAADRHQHANAAYLVEAGAARMLDQAEADVERLTAELDQLCDDRAALLERANAARRCRWPNAATTIADHVVAAAGGQS